MKTLRKYVLLAFFISTVAYAVTINDDFTYPNGALSGNATWTTTTYDGSLTISSNNVVGSSDELTRGNIHTGSWDATQTSTITFSSGSNGYLGAIVHGSDSGSGLNGYTFGCIINSSGLITDCFLEELTNGTASPLDTANAGGGSAAGVTIGIGIDVNDVVGYVNGVELARATDTTFRTSNPGIFLYSATGSSQTLGDWVGTGASGGGGGLVVNPLSGKGGAAAQPVYH